jgi:hypothetical protein
MAMQAIEELSVRPAALRRLDVLKDRPLFIVINISQINTDSLTSACKVVFQAGARGIWLRSTNMAGIINHRHKCTVKNAMMTI